MAGHCSFDQQQISFGVNANDDEILYSSTNGSHMAGHLLALPYTTRTLVLTDGARRPVGKRVAVRGVLHVEVMTFYGAGEAFTDRCPDNVNFLALFEEGQKVDVIGTTIGKGFAGTVKRHHFHMQDATHGNSLAHRAPGSIGQNQSPGRVWKGKKMAGHMGTVRRTVQNLVVVRVDAERNLLLIKGAVPGHAGGSVVVRPAIKSKKGAAS